MLPSLIALALLIVPPLSGWAGGGILRRALPPAGARRAAAAAIAITLCALPFAVISELRLSIYDALLIALLAAAGLLARSIPRAEPRPSRAGLLLSAGATLLAFTALELVARRLPNAPPRDYRPLDAMHLYFPVERRDFRCGILYPEISGWKNVNFHFRISPEQHARTPGVPRTLYVGDSMVDGDDVPLEADFTELIAAARPREQNWNLAMGGLGPDGYLLVTSKWARELRPDRVVLFVFLGNDIYDMDKPYSCCRWGPLTDEKDGLVEARCEHPDWREPIARRLDVGPAPYPLRVLSRRSELARRLAYLFEFATRGAKPWVYTDWAGTPAQLRRFGHTMDAIRDDLRSLGVGLEVVLLPPRWTLQRHQPADDPFVEQHREVLRMLRESGIATFDTWDLFQQAIDRDGGRSDIFQRHDGSPHLGVAGHRLLADWLLANGVAR